jgi:hypothetical protein
MAFNPFDWLSFRRMECNHDFSPWHIFCSSRRIMATKDKLMRLLQEVRGLAELTNPHPSMREPSPLFLLQMRSHLAETSRSKRRLIVNVDELAEFPQTIKITHLKSSH